MAVWAANCGRWEPRLGNQNGQRSLMEGPDYVRAAHDAFLKAGADIVTPTAMQLCHFTLAQCVYARPEHCCAYQ